jgi:hypothetical protein
MEPSKDWKEKVAPDEEARFARYASLLVELQRRNAVAGRAGRALHHKQVGGYAGRLQIFDGLPEYARHGLFARPNFYDTFVRFSNGSSVVQGDDPGDVRGMAV